MKEEWRPKFSSFKLNLLTGSYYFEMDSVSKYPAYLYTITFRMNDLHCYA
jgi:hypothetical protein